MGHIGRPAIILVFTLALASCSGSGLGGGYGFEDQSVTNQTGTDPSLIGAGLLLALLVAVSASN